MHIAQNSVMELVSVREGQVSPKVAGEGGGGALRGELLCLLCTLFFLRALDYI